MVRKMQRRHGVRVLPACQPLFPHDTAPTVSNAGFCVYISPKGKFHVVHHSDIQFVHLGQLEWLGRWQLVKKVD